MQKMTIISYIEMPKHSLSNGDSHVLIKFTVRSGHTIAECELYVTDNDYQNATLYQKDLSESWRLLSRTPSINKMLKWLEWKINN
jgi:hypothetical protein